MRRFGTRRDPFPLQASVIGPIKPGPPGPTNVYWNTSNVGDPWSTVGDWWQNSGATIPLGRIPIAGDYLYLQGPNSPSTGPATVIHFAGLDTSQLQDVLDNPNEGFGVVTPNIFIKSGGTLNFGSTTYNSVMGWWGPVDSGAAAVSFYGSSQLCTTLPYSGDAAFYTYFYDSSQINGEGDVVGTAILHDSSQNNGVISENAEFHDNSYNTQSGAVIGNGSFFDYSINNTDGTYYGTIYGAGNFSDYSQNSGVVYGYCAFDTQAINYYSCLGDASFTDDTSNQTTGIVAGSASFTINSYNGGEIGSGDFTDGTFNLANTDSGATFHSNAYNEGFVGGDAYFYDDSYNAGGELGADSYYFNETSMQGGLCDGTCNFNDDSSNEGGNCRAYNCNTTGSCP